LLANIRVTRGEANVRGRGRLQPRLELAPGAIDCAAQLLAQTCEPILGERVQQCLTVGEVSTRRTVADADLARELAQRELLNAALADDPLCLREQRGAQVSVVVGALRHRLAA
jgi:hypothetical protein